MKQNFQLHYFYSENEKCDSNPDMVYAYRSTIAYRDAKESENEEGIFHDSCNHQDSFGNHVGCGATIAAGQASFCEDKTPSIQR